MIYFNDEGKVSGFGNPTEQELKYFDGGRLFVGRGRLCWEWPDYPEGKPVYSPQPYPPEQLEELRNEWVKAEIENLYPNDLQLKINTENMDSIISGQGGTNEFAQMMLDRKKIKEESKNIDFNEVEHDATPIGSSLEGFGGET